MKLNSYARSSVYSIFQDHIGGIILAHNASKDSMYFQPGDEANEFAASLAELDSDEAFNNFLSEYEISMVDAHRSGGQPSDDGTTYEFKV